MKYLDVLEILCDLAGDMDLAEDQEGLDAAWLEKMGHEASTIGDIINTLGDKGYITTAIERLNRLNNPVFGA